MITLLQIIFYAFAVLAISSALLVVTLRNPIRSVLSLVVTFFSMAGIWMILRAEFLSLILLLVYIGAVMTLFLFVVMMLNINREYKQATFVGFLPFGMIIVMLFLGVLLIAVGPKYFGVAQMPIPQPEPAHFSNLRYLGAVLYTDYAYPFEIAGILLLTAMIAAITLTHRAPQRRKVQQMGTQIAVRKEDRVRLIKLPSHKNEKGTG